MRREEKKREKRKIMKKITELEVETEVLLCELRNERERNRDEEKGIMLRMLEINEELKRAYSGIGDGSGIGDQVISQLGDQQNRRKRNER